MEGRSQSRSMTQSSLHPAPGTLPAHDHAFSSHGSKEPAPTPKRRPTGGVRTAAKTVSSNIQTFSCGIVPLPAPVSHLQPTLPQNQFPRLRPANFHPIISWNRARGHTALRDSIRRGGLRGPNGPGNPQCPHDAIPRHGRRPEPPEPVSDLRRRRRHDGKRGHQCLIPRAHWLGEPMCLQPPGAGTGLPATDRQWTTRRTAGLRHRGIRRLPKRGKPRA